MITTKFDTNTMTVEAVMLGLSNAGEIVDWLIENGVTKVSWELDKLDPIYPTRLTFDSLIGEVTLKTHDYIIKDSYGDLYPMDADIFELTYHKHSEDVSE